MSPRQLCRRRRAPGRAAGFGLLEALVALVLLSLVGLAGFGWINTNLDAAMRLLAHEQDLRDRELAGAWVTTLDPARQPAGEVDLEPGLRLRWQAKAQGAWQAVAPLPGGLASGWQVAAFELDLELVRDAPARTQHWRQTRLGVRSSGRTDAGSP